MLLLIRFGRHFLSLVLHGSVSIHDFLDHPNQPAHTDTQLTTVREPTPTEEEIEGSTASGSAVNGSTVNGSVAVPSAAAFAIDLSDVINEAVLNSA
eukprot:m.178696 g.178696  ORF g.178696 m.178696 type:complete len:96 (-) comp53398_c0_seq1:22-309(-)